MNDWFFQIILIRDKWAVFCLLFVYSENKLCEKVKLISSLFIWSLFGRIYFVLSSIPLKLWSDFGFGKYKLGNIFTRFFIRFIDFFFFSFRSFFVTQSETHSCFLSHSLCLYRFIWSSYHLNNNWKLNEWSKRIQTVSEGISMLFTLNICVRNASIINTPNVLLMTFSIHVKWNDTSYSSHNQRVNYLKKFI